MTEQKRKGNNFNRRVAFLLGFNFLLLSSISFTVYQLYLNNLEKSIFPYIVQTGYNYSEYQPDAILGRERTQLHYDRVKTSSDYCKTHLNASFTMQNVFVLPEKNLLVCLQPKAATTYLMKLLGKVGKDPKISIKTRNKGCQGNVCLIPFELFLEKNLDYNFESFEKVMFAREPMERLVSAFHALLNNENVSQENYELYTKPIVNLLRYKETRMMPANAKAAWKMGLRMSFAEFVRGLFELNEKEFTENIYWSPQVKNCGLCQLNYTFIGNVATFDEDGEYLLQRFNIPKKENILHTVQTDTYDVLKQFTGIDINIRARLVDIFRQDYEAFKFPTPTYLGL